MRALAASGRRGAALEVYEQTRERLADLLGVDPSAELAALHLDILRADRVPAAPPAEPRRGYPLPPRREITTGPAPIAKGAPCSTWTPRSAGCGR